MPELGGVLNAGNGLVLGLTLDGPSSLGDPEGLTASNSLNLVVCLPEEVGGVVDRVALTVLVEGVLVKTKEVNGAENGRVGGVGEGVPGINVTDGNIGEDGILDELTDLANVVDENVGRLTVTTLLLDTGLGDAVQVLGTDRDTDGQVGKTLGAELADGGLESGKLVVESLLVLGSPETEKKSGVGLDGSGNGGDDSVSSAVLDHGVETSRGVVGDGLGRLELGGESVKGVALRSVVETTAGGHGRGSAASESVKRGTHFDLNYPSIKRDGKERKNVYVEKNPEERVTMGWRID